MADPTRRNPAAQSCGSNLQPTSARKWSTVRRRGAVHVFSPSHRTLPRLQPFWALVYDVTMVLKKEPDRELFTTSLQTHANGVGKMRKHNCETEWAFTDFQTAGDQCSKATRR